MTTTETTRHLTAQTARAARLWYIADADGQVVGRLASRIASVLRGKTKPSFSPHVDAGDFVVVINAAKLRFTGKKLTDKIYTRHSEYPGGARHATAGEALAKHPTRVLRDAVEGMLPKNRLGRRLVTKLKVYSGSEHPHEAQKPRPLPAK